MRKFAFQVAAVLVASQYTFACGQSADSQAIQNKLNAQITITKVAADRSDIVTPGSIVALRKDGLMMYSVTSPLPPSNTYKNGKIGQGWGGFGKDFTITMMAPGGATSASYPQRKLPSNEKCWVTQIQVQKDGILLQLYSDPVDNIRYYANLKVPFSDKKRIPSPEAVLQILGEVLSVDTRDANSQVAGTAALTGPAAGDVPQAVSVPQQAEHPLQAIAPPPPPPDEPLPPPPTVSLGQTMDQVIGILGQPKNVAKASTKTIFTYANLKVVFVNGKVSDVE